MNEKLCISIKISLKFVPKGPINNKAVLVQVMAWCRTGKWLSYLNISRGEHKMRLAQIPRQIARGMLTWHIDVQSFPMNLTGLSATLMSITWFNFNAIWAFSTQSLPLRGFTRSHDKTLYQIWNRTTAACGTFQDFYCLSCFVLFCFGIGRFNSKPSDIRPWGPFYSWININPSMDK